MGLPVNEIQVNKQHNKQQIKHLHACIGIWTKLPLNAFLYFLILPPSLLVPLPLSRGYSKPLIGTFLQHYSCTFPNIWWLFPPTHSLSQLFTELWILLNVQLPPFNPSLSLHTLPLLDVQSHPADYHLKLLSYILSCHHLSVSLLCQTAPSSPLIDYPMLLPFLKVHISQPFPSCLQNQLHVLSCQQTKETNKSCRNYKTKFHIYLRKWHMYKAKFSNLHVTYKLTLSHQIPAVGIYS